MPPFPPGTAPSRRSPPRLRSRTTGRPSPDIPEPAPGVPPVDLHPGADPRAVANGIRLAGVVPRDPVDVAQLRIVHELGDLAQDADVGDPVVRVHCAEAHPRVGPQVREALP